MSKNVAVFVDVANIFYAAKAAGADIDYVTLLKSAIAGRDFVRAYAYTGLDPDNENQRQFHSFLARNGYKVVSKDIRKYGDGRIKANLDIELVVDLMRLARNLDIAVVVSGDGDFAPAIRAVQQMGVRVEVISFRGNTSSDLIEVADGFTDIAQIARIEKGSARSGRRIAAEGDLSMTEVPEKETEGVPRRQRGRRSERQPAAAAGAADNLIVLPGERLSRAGEEGAPEAAGEADELEVVPAAADEAEPADATEDGRRRRRRRGGRGRGRGRRAEVDVLAGGEPAGDEEEEFEDVVPAPLPHHTFGSVWDSQLGVPSAPLTPVPEVPEEDQEEEDLEEPEIPEYLLAERRQRGQRGRGRTGRRQGYQAALDRERYGRGASSGFGGARVTERQRGERQRGRQQQRPGRGDRPQRQQERPATAGRPAGARSEAPWSEVPPELEELLRAELARKSPSAAEAAAEPAAEAEAEAATEAPAEAPKRTRRRSTKAAGDGGSGDAAQPAPAEAEAEPEAPKRTTRRRSPKASAEGDAGDAAQPATAEAEPEAPKRTTRRRSTRASAEAEAEPEAPKRTTRRRSTKASAEEESGEG